MVKTAVKGTVRPLADTISVEEAERAGKRVQEAISQQQQQLKDLERFYDENKALSKLVLELPDAVSHRIMVPFGKAAFFPGRLIHTNEFLVLLGEGYYAERSAKQTVEILGRRSELIDKKLAGAKSQIADLEAESNFVTSTAEEAKAGLVEIREEYIGSSELQANQVSLSRITAEAVSTEMVGTTSSSTSKSEEDFEHELLMARLSELELAEAARVDDSTDEGSEEDEDDDEDGDEYEDDGNVGVDVRFRSNLHKELVSGREDNFKAKFCDGEDIEDENKDLVEISGDEEDDEENNQVANKSSEVSTDTFQSIAKHKQIDRPHSTASKAFTGSVTEHHSTESPTTAHKAFTGTVTERHGPDLSSLAVDGQVKEPQPSRPISKFKMRQAQVGK